MNKPKPSGPKTLKGSKEAKKVTAVLLEVLSGVMGPQVGCETMGVSLSRYYTLETRGLQGMITALEPRPRGRQSRPEDVISETKRENDRLKRELQRSQSLVRAAERSIGIPRISAAQKGSKISGKGKTKTGKTRRRIKVVRATRAIAALRKNTESTTPEEARP